MSPELVKIPKPSRLPIGNIPNKKKAMSEEDLRFLLSGRVVVEEKMDGRPISFAALDPQLVVFAEDLRRVHSIFYWLPGRYAVFDIFDIKRNLFLRYDERTELAQEIRRGKIRISGKEAVLFFPIPRIALGKFTLEELPQFLGAAAYARNPKNRTQPALGEGIVVKPHCDQFLVEYLAGKIVREEFTDGITGSYLRRPFQPNIIDPSKPVIIEIASPGLMQ